MSNRHTNYIDYYSSTLAKYCENTRFYFSLLKFKFIT